MTSTFHMPVFCVSVDFALDLWPQNYSSFLWILNYDLISKYAYQLTLTYDLISIFAHYDRWPWPMNELFKFYLSFDLYSWPLISGLRIRIFNLVIKLLTCVLYVVRVCLDDLCHDKIWWVWPSTLTFNLHIQLVGLQLHLFIWPLTFVSPVDEVAG